MKLPPVRWRRPPPAHDEAGSRPKEVSETDGGHYLGGIPVEYPMVATINELHASAAAGDKQAQNQLFAELTDRFRLFAHLKLGNTDDSEELVQSALATVASEYRDLKVTTSFAAWAHKVMENKFLAYLRSRGRQRGRNVPLENAPNLTGTWELDPGLKMRLLDCFGKLVRANKRYARILNLHRLGFSREEVCVKLGLTANQSYVLMSRARTVLKECLQDGGFSL